jgi:fumarate reductase flavoprotein subunit
MNYKQNSAVDTLETEIVIIGGGGGGLTAAVAAKEKGADVILIEKRRTTGGNAATAGGIFAAESPAQRRMKIDARKDEAVKFAMRYSHCKINPRIFRAFVDKSGDTIQWLEEMGLEFDVPHFLPNQVPRVFHVPRGSGAKLVRVLTKKCENLGVRLHQGTTANRISIDEKGKISEVHANTKGKELKIVTRAVIIATGGYAGNKELLKKHYPDYTEGLYSVGLPLMGDGLLMATEIGAATEGLGILQLRGPYFRGSLMVVTAAMEPITIWVNQKGERFIDEAIGFYWPEAANALNRQPDKLSYTLFDEKIMQSFVQEGTIKGYSHFPPTTKLTDLEKKLQLEAEKGGVKISDSWEQIAGWIGTDSEVLKATINEYNTSCDRGYDEIFLKDQRFLRPLRTPPYVAVKCYQGFLGTLGGIKINHHMEVVNQVDIPIPGLYAAGNDTGGWESDTYCLPLSGSAFGFAINSGRIAGENAAKYILGK